MILEFGIILGVFWSLVAVTLSKPGGRLAMFARTKAEWALDLVSLSIQGALAPLVQVGVVFGLLTVFAPDAKGSLQIPAWAAFLLNFVVVDYIYYWNHRLLHKKTLWRFHALHHSGATFDVFTSSRNSAVTTFLIVYVWVNGVFLYLLADPIPYAAAILASNCLDLLRHARWSRWPRWFPANILVSPRDHAWHHCVDVHEVNFGGNFNLWDKLHGTYHVSQELPARYGETVAPERLLKAFLKGMP